MNYRGDNTHCQQTIVPYSKSENRANLMSYSGQAGATNRRKRSQSKSGQKRRPSSTKRQPPQRRRRNKTRVTKVRLVKGKVSLRIQGYPGTQKIGASQLVRFIPLNKLKIAAKRVLGSTGVKKNSRRKRRRHHSKQQSSSLF